LHSIFYTAAGYLFTYPPHSFWVPDPLDQITLLIFVVVGFGIALLSQSQRHALQRAAEETMRRRDAEHAERAERQRFETTLASIGDGVIGTNANGKVSFMNVAAEALTGWKREQGMGTPVQAVFQIIDEDTHQPAENPALLPHDAENRLTEEQRIMQRIQHGEKVEHLESERRRRDATIFPVLLTISPIHDATLDFIGERPL
jgi:PAS domain-containing protein